MRWARLLPIAFGLGLGCAPVYGDAYLGSLAAGHRAYHAGRYEEAARAYDRAAGEALRVKDRDEARFLQARTLERAQRWHEADGAYKRLIADSPTGPRTGRAEFEIADVAIAHGDAELGWRLLFEAARRRPTHGLARPAIARLAAHAAERGGKAAAVTFLRDAAPAFAGTELEQVVAYETARALENAGREAEARDAYLATAAAHPYPFGGLTDDAYWRAALVEEKLGRFTQAITILKKMLTPREVSTLNGSYERPRYPEAQHRIALIYRDNLKDPVAARREFHKLYTDHPTSILRDDALWSEARLAREAGDAAQACSLVALLVRELPESRYAACAQAMCPGAEAPRGSRECGEYIRRELEGEAGAEAGTEAGTKD